MVKKIKNQEKILITGDIHGNFKRLRIVIEEQKPDIVLNVGDFGFFPKISNVWKTIRELELVNHIPIYWCDGNHEDHESLLNLTEDFENYNVPKNLYYMSRGSILQLFDGRNILFFGGAESIDKHRRIPGFDWFPEESITNKDIYKLPNTNVNIDVVISHTCPLEFDIGLDDFTNSPSRKALSYILGRYHPKQWYFGHFHYYKEGVYKSTSWTMLNMIDEEKSITFLKREKL